MALRLSLGIDEAGRGCVIGSLVMAGFLMPEDESLVEQLNDLGVKDSKLLVSSKREELAKQIKKIAHSYKIVKIKPQMLDKFSLNKLEAEFSAQLINCLKPHKVYLDCPASGRGIHNYCQMVLMSCQHKKYEIVGANKMDRDNILAAAASILAKSERERHIKLLKKQYGDFGSGYPSDPKTIKWLVSWKKTRGEWPSIVRRKWSTLHNIKDKKLNIKYTY